MLKHRPPLLIRQDNEDVSSSKMTNDRHVKQRKNWKQTRYTNVSVEIDAYTVSWNVKLALFLPRDAL